MAWFPIQDHDFHCTVCLKRKKKGRKLLLGRVRPWCSVLPIKKQQEKAEWYWFVCFLLLSPHAGWYHNMNISCCSIIVPALLSLPSFSSGRDSVAESGASLSEPSETGLSLFVLCTDVPGASQQVGTICAIIHGFIYYTIVVQAALWVVASSPTQGLACEGGR